MKICWDNLEKIKLNRNGDFSDGKNSYIYMNSCKSCGESYLSRKDIIGDFCNKSCSNNGKFNNFYRKKHSNESKKIIGNKSKERKFSIESRRKMGLSCSGKNNPNWKGGYDEKNIPLYDTYAHQIEYVEEVRRNKDDRNILEVKCTYCGKWYISTIYKIQNRINSLNGNGTGECRFYCSNECKQECSIYNQKKYPKGYKIATSREVQPELRQMVFERDNYICQKCGNNKSLHCHHIEGIRWEPLESADIDKCITYCKKCHKEVHVKDGCKTKDMQCKE